MAAVDWGSVAAQAVAAAANALKGSWSTVESPATHSIQVLTQTAAYIAANADSLDADEQKLLTDNQKLAMQNVLLGYEDIGIVAAEQAVAAAWGVVQTALVAAIGRV
jgi:hypothetical protein